MRSLLFVIIVLALSPVLLSLLFLAYFYLRPNPCPLEATTTQALVVGTEWVIQLRGHFCGFGVYAPGDLVAVNNRNAEVVTIGDGDGDIKIESTHPGEVVVTLPNRSDMLVQPFTIPGVHVIFHWTPADDPEDRSRYIAWVHDQADEANRVWFCRHVFKEALRGNDLWNTTKAERLWPHGPRKAYCDTGDP